MWPGRTLEKGMRPEDRQPRWESCVTAFTFAGAVVAGRLHGSLPRAGITALDTEETNNGQAEERREQSVAKAHHFKRSRKHGTTRVVCRFDTAFLFLGRKKGGARRSSLAEETLLCTVLFQERRSVVLRSTGGRRTHKITLRRTPTPPVNTHKTKQKLSTAALKV